MENLYKKRIGIITFHWATNYGAVLQCYALQTFLEKKGYQVEIVNYKPREYNLNFLKCLKFNSIGEFAYKIRTVIKEVKIIPFRRLKLNLTSRFFSQMELINKSEKLVYDYLITGSDQVWNEYFITKGEKGNNFNSVYFLGFGSPKIKRIGYGVSFGTLQYPPSLVEKLLPLINSFSFIGVRESTGLNILNQFGFLKNELVCDPTLLLIDKDYSSLFSKKRKTLLRKELFLYILRDKKNLIGNRILKAFDTDEYWVNKSLSESIEKWIENVYNASIVITNSYHGMIFSILFKKNFMVFLDKKEPMNDRFYTLLSKLNLMDRIVYSEDFSLVNQKIMYKIDWIQVDSLLDEFRKKSANLLIYELNL